MATVSMEPPIQVGDVAAVYVTVTNLRSVDFVVIARPSDMTGHQVNEVIVLQAHAVTQSGGQVDRLDVDHAIEKAGGADKLLAALGDPGFDVVAPPAPSSGAEIAFGAVGLILVGAVFFPIVAATVAAAPVALPIMYATGAFSDEQKIKDKEFQVGRYYGEPPLLGGPPQRTFIVPQYSWKGYLYFPQGSYSTLEITAGAIDDSSVPPETRCGGWLGLCANAFETIAQQIDRGESPTLRHTETIRRPWRQG